MSGGGKAGGCRAVACGLVLLVLAAASVSAHAVLRPHGRATHAFTVVASAPPRLMVSGADAHFVEITLRNDGMTDWDPGARYSLSYHWRTLFDKMAQRDGTRTPLPRLVPPGGVITLTAEVGPPPRAGIYVLEWDMVQEDVTWFSQRDRAPLTRALVVVLPSAAFVASLCLVMPAITATFGLLLLWRARRWTPGRDGLARRAGPIAALAALLLPGWDLAWCFSSLLFKQLALLPATELDFTATGFLMSVLLAAVPPLLLLLVNERTRPRLAWLAAAAGSLVLLADIVYYRFFGDVISIAALSAGSQAGHLVESVRSLLVPADAWIGLDLLIALPLVPRLAALPRPPARWSRRLVAAFGLGLVALAAVPSPVAIVPVGSDSDSVFRHLNVAEDMGLAGYHLDDVVRHVKSRLVRPSLSAREMADAREWFVTHTRERAGSGAYFGAARGRSLVFILVESLQAFVVGLEVNGHEITPNLNRLRGEALWSAGLVDQSGEGRTSDAELLNAVSLLPLSHGAAAFRYPANHFVALPDQLAKRGYSTFSAVPFDGGFWNRTVTHPSYGLARSFFARDFAPGKEVGWGLNDRGFLQQMRERLRTAPRPYCAWIITLGLHHPFDSFPDDLKELDLGRWNGTRLGNYLHAMHLFDRGLGELVAGLQQDGVLNDTVLAVEGDHEAGLPWEDVAKATGVRRDTLNWYLADRVPLVVRVPGAQAPRGELRTTAGQADVAPTLLALLGVDPAPLPFVGRNLLGAPGEAPVVRRYGDWIDSRHLFLAGQGYTSRQACFDLALHSEVPLTACRAAQVEAVTQLGVSHRVLTHGLQQQFVASAGPRR